MRIIVLKHRVPGNTRPLRLATPHSVLQDENSHLFHLYIREEHYGMIALTTAQIIAIVIFVVVMALIISEKVQRPTLAYRLQKKILEKSYGIMLICVKKETVSTRKTMKPTEINRLLGSICVRNECHLH